MQKDKRRTGAGMFVKSGTVRDDPLVFSELQTCGVGFDLSKLNVDGAWDVASLISSSTAHIYHDSQAAVECGFRFLHSQAWDFSLDEWKIAW